MSHFCYPETKDRSLESIDTMSSPSSPFHSKMEQAYRNQGDVLATRGFSFAQPRPNATNGSVSKADGEEGSFGSDEGRFEKL